MSDPPIYFTTRTEIPVGSRWLSLGGWGSCVVVESGATIVARFDKVGNMYRWGRDPFLGDFIPCDLARCGAVNNTECMLGIGHETLYCTNGMRMWLTRESG